MSFYNLDSLLMPRSDSNKESTEPTIGHKTDGSYLVAEDADGTEEVGEEDTETWLDDMDCVQDQESCFDMECDIDLIAVVVTQVLEGKVLDSGKEMDEKSGSDADEVNDPDSRRHLGLVDSTSKRRP